MTLSEFKEILQNEPDGVVLLEGRRSIPSELAVKAKKFAANLASSFPNLRFRSGNAAGSDQAFSDGVASIDPTRLHIIAPYKKHRQNAKYVEATYDTPDTLTEIEEESVALLTAQASPKNKDLIEKRNKHYRLGMKAKYLMRDTMKVIGNENQYPKPICAFFYVKPEDPNAGGTGHTIRVCQKTNVPVVLQEDWLKWFEGG